MDGLIQRNAKEKSRELLGPLKILYHKEKVRPMVVEMSLFLDENAEAVAWDATTRTSEDKEELGDESKRATYYKEDEREDFEDHLIDTDEHEDINLSCINLNFCVYIV